MNCMFSYLVYCRAVSVYTRVGKTYPRLEELGKRCVYGLYRPSGVYSGCAPGQGGPCRSHGLIRLYLAELSLQLPLSYYAHIPVVWIVVAAHSTDRYNETPQE